MEKEIYLPFPKNPSLSKFRAWLKRNFGFAEYHDTLDVILDSDYPTDYKYTKISYCTKVDRWERPIGETNEIYSIIYKIYDETLIMTFEYIPDSHYYGFYKERNTEE